MRRISLIKKEKIIFSRSVTPYIFLILLSWLTGNSFITAVQLYSNASLSAINDPFYAKSFEPIQGIFVPVMGGFFLLFSLLLPFVITPLLSRERENNTIFFLYNLGYTPGKILSTKFLFLSTFIFLSLTLLIPLLIFWETIGGHISWSELSLLVGGYFLYALFISAISLFSASIFKNLSAAIMLALTIILSSWIVDFIKTTTYSKLINQLSNYTLTHLLRYFEKGILNIGAIFLFILTTVFLLMLATILITPSSNKEKIAKTTFVSLIYLALISIAFLFNIRKDIAESRRNSFPNPVVEQIKKLPPLKIKIYMSKTDSRFQDYKREFLDKILLVKNIQVEFAKGKDLEENYGKIVYALKIKKHWLTQATYSNSKEEAFQIISKLSGIKFNISENPYPGYPLVVAKKKLVGLKYLYYGVFPILFLLAYPISIRRIRYGKKD